MKIKTIVSTALMCLVATSVKANEDVKTNLAPTSLSVPIYFEQDADTNDITVLETMGMLGLLSKHSEGQLSFQQISMSFSRAWYSVSVEKTGCLYNKIKTPEREALALFSHFPVSVFPPLRLIVTKKNQSFFQSPVELTALSSKGERFIGVAKGRMYSQAVEDAKVSTPSIFYERAGEDASNMVIEMLKKNRVRGVIEYAEVVNTFNQRVNENFDYVALPIKNSEEPITGYMLCAKSDFGQQAISLIDEVMQKPAFQQEFIDMHLATFNEQEISLMRHSIEAMFSDSRGVAQ